MKRWIGFAALSLGIILASGVRAADQPVNLVQNGDTETGTLDGWAGFGKVISDSPHFGISVPTKWTKFTGILHGLALSGAPNDQWWPGTKYAQVLLLLNFGQKDAVSVAADDISVTVSEK